MTREPMDRYYTPQHVWAEVLSDLRPVFGEPRCIIDPCVGGGSLQRAARSKGIRLHVVGDLDPLAPGLENEVHHIGSVVGDMGVAAWSRFIRACVSAPNTWIITNPPYADADTVGSLLRFHRRVETDLLVLLLRASILKGLVSSRELRPREVVYLDSRPIWEGPGGALLLQEAQARARKAGKPIPTTAPADMVDTVVCVWGPEASGTGRTTLRSMRVTS